MRIVPIFLAITAFLAGCKNGDEEKCAFIPDTSGKKVTVKVEQLEDSVTRFSSKEELVGFFSRNTVLRDVFFNRKAYPDETRAGLFVSSWRAKCDSPSALRSILEKLPKTRR